MLRWFERAYAVPAKRTAVLQGMAALVILSATVTSAALVYTDDSSEQTTIWIPSQASLTPFYKNEKSVTPAGYIIEEKGGKKIICQVEKDGLYLCITD